MRIVAGVSRGRRLVAPGGDATRPTADRVRQALFDMLAHAPWAHPDGLRGRIVLDGFAGSGALGIEALSRGARHATFLDNRHEALVAVRINLGRDHPPRATLLLADATDPPRTASAAPADLVFLDPPYGRRLVLPALAALGRMGWIAPDAIVAIETAADEDPGLGAPPIAERRHGSARISFHRPLASP